MVRYVPPSRRRWRLVATAIVALAVGVAAGLLIGRSMVTTAQEQAQQVRSRALDLATRVQALTIEYDQAVAAQGDTIQAGVVDPMQGIIADADRTMQRAVWLGAEDRTAVDDALRAVRQAALDRVPADQFATATATAAGVLTRTLGASSG
jgi:hypothetical protein